MEEVENCQREEIQSQEFLASDKTDKLSKIKKTQQTNYSEKRKHLKNGNSTDLKMSEFQKIENIEKNHKNGTINSFNDDKKLKHVLRKKVFETRNSTLTDLFNEIKHIKTIYNFFVALFLIAFLNTAVYDVLQNGSLSLGFFTIKLGFGKMTTVIKMWCFMVASSYSVYYFYNFYAHQRIKFSPKSFQLKIWDYSWFLLFVAYQLTFLVLPAHITLKSELPPPSATIVLMEQVRLIMKIHAFVRSTVPSIFNRKLHDGSEDLIPKFNKFSYFMFAPTLIYQDNYPRTKKIRWRVAAKYFLEAVFTILFISLMFERFVLPAYKDFGREPFNLHTFSSRIVSTALPGMIIFLCGFYCLLHAWMNGCAELMRFGDRLFYQDWWTSVSYDKYYRTWNIVVYDWLYTYIYRDFYEKLFPGNKLIATFFVFFTSAVVHEYILACVFRFFYPVMFVFFGVFGFVLVFITKKESSAIGNIFLWFSLIIGSGMMVSFYTMEYFARLNCPGLKDQLLDSFIPRSWHCYDQFSGNGENHLVLYISTLSFLTSLTLLYKKFG
ncbi:sterol O-acyltransferase 1 isoform X1 [Cotesia typhae]|uniref:sterol O-acyltransferase 1 isoform X1 n=2 Tax=Cotesia typhae TaxID=2053667 RepID=UPI003D69E2D4